VLSNEILTFMMQIVEGRSLLLHIINKNRRPPSGLPEANIRQQILLPPP
jgi:hypothetical protein